MKKKESAENMLNYIIRQVEKDSEPIELHIQDNIGLNCETAEESVSYTMGEMNANMG